MGITILFRYMMIAKIATLLMLSKKYRHHFNPNFWQSAIFYTFIIMMFHLFTELLGINFDQEFSLADIGLKIALNLFPALLYFWILEKYDGTTYWIIWAGGALYFILIMKLTLMV